MNVESKADRKPLHKFIGAFRYGLKAAVGGASVRKEFGPLAGAARRLPRVLVPLPVHACMCHAPGSVTDAPRERPQRTSR